MSDKQRSSFVEGRLLYFCVAQQRKLSNLLCLFNIVVYFSLLCLRLFITQNKPIDFYMSLLFLYLL